MHVLLALAGRLVGDFGLVVGVAAGVVDDGRHDGPAGGAVAVAPEAISDEAVRTRPLRLSNLGRNRAAAWRSRRGWQDVDDLAILVDSPPEVQALAADPHEEFVQMPRIADWVRPTPEPSRVGRTERLAPVPDGLVRHP